MSNWQGTESSIELWQDDNRTLNIWKSGADQVAISITWYRPNPYSALDDRVEEVYYVTGRQLEVVKEYFAGL